MDDIPLEITSQDTVEPNRFLLMNRWSSGRGAWCFFRKMSVFLVDEGAARSQPDPAPGHPYAVMALTQWLRPTKLPGHPYLLIPRILAARTSSGSASLSRFVALYSPARFSRPVATLE